MTGKATWPQCNYETNDVKEHAVMLKLSLNEMLRTFNEGSRPSKEEVAKAIEAMMLFIDQAIAESKIQRVLEKVRKLVIDSNNRDRSIEEKLTHIKHQASSIASSSTKSSYASVLGQSIMTSFSLGGVPVAIQSSASKQSQTPYNKSNEIVINIQDETASEALKGKKLEELTATVNEYIRNME